ncbi:MAG: HAD family phosphatase [Verrucomicrobia bacterium]|nr:MAG: HAD family phosphatase [Verrucomicrobiota bacterium]
MSGAISSVAFDLGGVLLHLNYPRVLREVLPLCDQHRGVCSEKFFGLVGRDPSMAEYERGDLSTREIFSRFVTLTGYHGTFEQFHDLWRSILAENPPMLEFGRELARQYDIYLWTNAGELHVPWIYEQFPALQFIKGDAVSCYLGAVKPNRAFYERALAKYDLRPEQVLFVDDRPENVESAREMGIVSVQYTAPTETIAAVRALLGGAAAAVTS